MCYNVFEYLISTGNREISKSVKIAQENQQAWRILQFLDAGNHFAQKLQLLELADCNK